MPSVEQHEHAHEHEEKHFTATAAVRDIVIGMSDGLTVPFALAAGLTSAAAAIAKGTRMHASSAGGNCATRSADDSGNFLASANAAYAD